MVEGWVRGGLGIEYESGVQIDEGKCPPLAIDPTVV